MRPIATDILKFWGQTRGQEYRFLYEHTSRIWKREVSNTTDCDTTMYMHKYADTVLLMVAKRHLLNNVCLFGIQYGLFCNVVLYLKLKHLLFSELQHGLTAFCNTNIANFSVAIDYHCVSNIVFCCNCNQNHFGLYFKGARPSTLFGRRLACKTTVER